MNSSVELEVEYPLSDSDLALRAMDESRLTARLNKLTAEFKDSAADWRLRIKAVKKERDDINLAIMEGSERVKVTCIEYINLDTKTADYIHQGKTIRSRDLTVEEIAQHGTKPMFEVEPMSAHEDLGHVIRAETKKTSKKDLMT